MTYQETLAYIHGAHKNPSHDSLLHIRTLLAAIGNPQNAYRCIHVAGTNGKGSFCAMSDAILRAAGYRVGLFTSPFIRRFEERFRINGECISEDELAEITELVKNAADQLEGLPFEFELVTAIGFEFFRRRQVDIVVLEVGMGGRLDPTNVIREPLLSVITGIDFDHTQFLGNTIQKIAAEKGAIIKSGFPALYGGTDSSACGTLTAIASTLRSPFYTVDCSRLRVQSYSPEGTVFDFGDLKGLQLPLLGSYQPQNAATVLTAMEILTVQHDLQITEEQLRAGLKSVAWPARFELLHKADPTVLFDGSHNPQGVGEAVKSIQVYFPDQTVNVLSGVMADKDYDGMMETLRPVVHTAYATAPSTPRALSAEDLASVFTTHGISAKGFPSVVDAVRAAVADSRAEGRPLICLGSLYLYRELELALELVLSE